MKVAVLGFGTIGKGVYAMLQDAPGMEAGPVLVRPGKADAPWKVTDIDDIVNDPSVDAVAEMMGGIEPAFSYASKALSAGKHFVTSNKALVAAHGLELAAVAREKKAAFLFSAACGGGVPFLHNLSLAVKTDKVINLGGILNGTTNYMLDAMQRRSLSYAEALSDAQQLGYAEADPTADVSGMDALRKIMLACAVGFDVLPTEGLLNEGIESIISDDVADFKRRSLVCRLVAKSGINEKGIYAFVEPTLLPLNAPECSVLDNYNMAKYTGQNSGPMVFMGQGAGRYPTASAVLRDLSCIELGHRNMLSESCKKGAAENGQSVQSYYVRLPEKFAPLLPIREGKSENGVLRAVSESVSVQRMHETVKKIRSEGAEVFFAGLECDKP